MEFLENNISNIVLILTIAYPPLIYVLPPNIANKIDLGIKIFKILADGLERAKQTKSGFSNELEETLIKKPIQKAKV